MATAPIGLITLINGLFGEEGFYLAASFVSS
jgi:hypothetical protein